MDNYDSNYRYELQNASADNAQREDYEYDSKNWQIVATGSDLRELLLDFIRSLNDEIVNIDNGWIRFVDNKTKDVICM